MKGRKPLCKPNDSPLPAITQPRLLFFRRRPIISHAVLADFTAQLVRKVEPSARQVASARCAVLDKRLGLYLVAIRICKARGIDLCKPAMAWVMAWLYPVVFSMFAISAIAQLRTSQDRLPSVISQKPNWYRLSEFGAKLRHSSPVFHKP